MPAITVRDLSPELHQELKKRAKKSRRSLNQEILHALELHVAAVARRDHVHETRRMESMRGTTLLEELLGLLRREAVRGRHSLHDLVSRIPDDYEPEEVDWGRPVGREVW